MIINNPAIIKRDGKAFLVSNIQDEKSNVEKEYYFSVSENYGDYFCDEVADAFLVAMLIPAMFSGQNIKINAPVSELLLYQIENSLIYTFSKVFDKQIIDIIPSSVVNPEFEPSGVVTGFSGGVDSFTTVLQHTSSEIPENLRLTHLSLFNVGAYGNDEVTTGTSFTNDSKRATDFSIQNNIPLIQLDSNISSAYGSYEIVHGFTPRMITCISAGVLALQKLIKIYLIASSDTIDRIRLDKWFQSSHETLIASFLSTLNTRIVIANPGMRRVEKIKKIASNELVQKHLYVCLADSLNEKGNVKIDKGSKPNCSECFKCLRVMSTLDILGSLDKYQQQFDLEKYELVKEDYFRHTIKNSNKNKMLKEIYDLIIERNFKVPKGAARALLLRKTKDTFKRFRVKAYRYFYYMIILKLLTALKSIAKYFSFKRTSKIEKYKFIG